MPKVTGWVDPAKIEVEPEDQPQSRFRGPMENEHERLLDLARSLKREGQKVPVVVERMKDGRMVLRAGFYRRRAALIVQIGDPDFKIQANIYPEGKVPQPMTRNVI